MTKFYVYEHWRPDLGVCFYVGMGSGKRGYRIERSGRNKNHAEVMRNLSHAGMCVEIRMVRGGLSEADAHSLEIERISFWKAVGSVLANEANGGAGSSGYKHTPEVRAIISSANKGKVLSAETREKISKSRQGISNGPLTEEHRRKISAAQRGKKHSEETKRKMSEVQKSRTRRPHKSKSNNSASINARHAENKLQHGVQVS